MQFKKILFIASEDAPGMRPYAYSVIKSLASPGLCHAIIVLRDEADKRHFAGLEKHCTLHFLVRPSGRMGKLMWHFRPGRLLDLISRLARQNSFDFIFTVTGEVCLLWVWKRLHKFAPVLHTVHDAIPHEYKMSAVNALKHKIFVSDPANAILRKEDNLICNSRHQVRWLRERYPGKNVYYCPFPSLVTPAIAGGTTAVPELAGTDDGYILFFGRIEYYKGVHLLYDCFKKNKALFGNRKLVLAGKGDHEDYYFDIDKSDGDVVVINRFIADEELKDLFERAEVAVYPYLSATQSGVLSLASYFGKKIVVSRVPFFVSATEGCDGVTVCDVNDSEKFALSLASAIDEISDSYSLYKNNYSQQFFENTIKETIEMLCSVNYIKTAQLFHK